MFWCRAGSSSSISFAIVALRTLHPPHRGLLCRQLARGRSSRTSAYGSSCRSRTRVAATVVPWCLNGNTRHRSTAHPVDDSLAHDTTSRLTAPPRCPQTRNLSSALMEGPSASRMMPLGSEDRLRQWWSTRLSGVVRALLRSQASSAFEVLERLDELDKVSLPVRQAIGIGC